MKYILSIVCCFLVFAVDGQQGKAFDKIQVDSGYIRYKKQLESLYTARGMQKDEIAGLLDQYSKLGLVSNESFGRVLSRLYEPGQGIAVLLYLFSNDSLVRVLLEPGVIRNCDTIRITKQELLELNSDIINSIHVYEKSAGRSPKKRGGEVTSNEPPRYNYRDAIARATKILIPADFDTSYRHLIIVPALNIGSIPFHILSPYKDSSYLIDRCSFSIAPSLLDIVKQRTKQFKAKDINIDEARLTLNEAMFVSNPVYPVSPDYVFPDLPGAKAEVANALKYTASHVLLDSAAATKEEVIKAMNGKDLVYFATHGVASTTDAMLKSFLVLTGESPYLTAKEIMDLRYKPNFIYPTLVVLSACQTGLGKTTEAGIAGLARSFLIGGSDHVIMSLWNVDDGATAFLMSRFMYYLNKQNFATPSDPLRHAIMDAKAQYKNPALWASFSCFGVDKGPLSPLGVKGIKLKINNTSNSEPAINIADSLEFIQKLYLPDRVHITSDEKQSDIVFVKGKENDSLFYPETHRLFAIIENGEIPQAMLKFGRYKYIRDLEIQDSSLTVDVRLVKMKNGVMNPAKTSKEFSVGDSMVVVIKNNCPFDVYVNLLDMQPDGIINAILPGALGDDTQVTKIPSKATKYFDDQPLEVGHPAGKEILKVFISRKAFDIQKLATLFLNIPDFILMEMGVSDPYAIFNLRFDITK
jgi:hypothetical protein